MSHNNAPIKDLKQLATLKGTLPPNAANKISKFSGKYAFLADDFPCEIEFEGDKYPSVLHAFCASKTDNKERRAQIAKMTDEKEMKQFSNQETLGWKWTRKKLKIKYEMLLQKFTANSDLGLKLLQTADAELVATYGYFDRYWGVYKGQGENHSGKLLMKLRAALRAERLNRDSILNNQPEQAGA
jgi:ribA/ribD-fused uncharacterized protein